MGAILGSIVSNTIEVIIYAVIAWIESDSVARDTA